MSQRRVKYQPASATDERVLPHQLVHRVRFFTHLARYEFADRTLPALDGGLVVDAGCGTGYGTHLLGANRSLLGVDISQEAIDYATEFYRSPTVRFQCADVTRLPVADGEVDAIVSFEVIEHISQPLELLREARRALRSGGLLIVSTPNALLSRWEGGRPGNPFHETEYTLEEFRALLDDAELKLRDLKVQRPGAVTKRMRRYTMAIGQRLLRGRDPGYLPPKWERVVHGSASPALARSSWKALRNDVSVRDTTTPEQAEFFVAVAEAV